jgi:hypothetical protein
MTLSIITAIEIKEKSEMMINYLNFQDKEFFLLSL